MTPEDIRKLLGGYATETLTEDERRALFEAALSDQELFDALMREQPLHELLRDPAARAHLLAALEPAPSFSARLARWFRRPVTLALAGTLAAALVAVSVVLRHPTPEPPKLVAQVTPLPPQALVEKPAIQPEPTAPVKRPTRPAPAAKAEIEPRTEVVAMAPAPRPVAVGGVIAGVVGGVPSSPTATSFRPREEKAGEATPQRMARAGVTVRAVSSMNLDLRYSVLLRGENGVFTAVDPSTTVRAGDLLRVGFEANDAGHLYLLERDPAGAWQLRDHAVLSPHVSYQAPAAAALQYGEPGSKQLLAVFARQESPEFTRPQPAQIEALVNQARGKPQPGAADPASQRLLFEIVLHIQ